MAKLCSFSQKTKAYSDCGRCISMMLKGKGKGGV